MRKEANPQSAPSYVSPTAAVAREERLPSQEWEPPPRNSAATRPQGEERRVSRVRGLGSVLSFLLRLTGDVVRAKGADPAEQMQDWPGW